MAVEDPEEGPGGGLAPSIFRPNWGLKGPKKIFWETASPPPPLPKDLDDFPSSLSQGLDPALFCFFFLGFELARELEPDQHENVVNETQRSTQSIAFI